MENSRQNLSPFLKLVKYPLLSEKSYKLYDKGQYTFIVDRSLKKNEIKYIFENIFSIKIIHVNTLILPLKKKRIGKFLGRKPIYKKVILSLQKGDNIKNIFD